ncbi:hypothetical protein C8Q78DRAFT_457675 [Trametes maxima]|nr:hypothetical protein C8Q78DRAFT_457675 [Trametes maxima]
MGVVMIGDRPGLGQALGPTTSHLALQPNCSVSLLNTCSLPACESRPLSFQRRSHTRTLAPQNYLTAKTDVSLAACDPAQRLTASSRVHAHAHSPHLSVTRPSSLQARSLGGLRCGRPHARSVWPRYESPRDPRLTHAKLPLETPVTQLPPTTRDRSTWPLPPAPLPLVSLNRFSFTHDAMEFHSVAPSASPARGRRRTLAGVGTTTRYMRPSSQPRVRLSSPTYRKSYLPASRTILASEVVLYGSAHRSKLPRRTLRPPGVAHECSARDLCIRCNARRARTLSCHVQALCVLFFLSASADTTTLVRRIHHFCTTKPRSLRLVYAPDTLNCSPPLSHTTRALCIDLSHARRTLIPLRSRTRGISVRRCPKAYKVRAGPYRRAPFSVFPAILSSRRAGNRAQQSWSAYTHVNDWVPTEP